MRRYADTHVTRKGHGLTPAAEILEALKKTLGINERSVALFTLWRSELAGSYHGAELAGIKGDTIYIEAASSAHLQDLSMRRKEIATKINQYFSGPRLVKNVKIYLKNSA